MLEGSKSEGFRSFGVGKTDPLQRPGFPEKLPGQSRIAPSQGIGIDGTSRESACDSAAIEDFGRRVEKGKRPDHAESESSAHQLPGTPIGNRILKIPPNYLTHVLIHTRLSAVPSAEVSVH